MAKWDIEVECIINTGTSSENGDPQRTPIGINTQVRSGDIISNSMHILTHY